MRTYVYYKVSPYWAKVLGQTETASRHPDGWFMILPAYAAQLKTHIVTKPDCSPWTAAEAVLAIGGKIYDTDQVLRSQRGEEPFMMTPERCAEIQEGQLYTVDGRLISELEAEDSGAEDGKPESAGEEKPANTEGGE